MSLFRNYDDLIIVALNIKGDSKNMILLIKIVADKLSISYPERNDKLLNHREL